MLVKVMKVYLYQTGNKKPSGFLAICGLDDMCSILKETFEKEVSSKLEPMTGLPASIKS